MTNSKKKSSADWDAEAEALRKKLDAARKEARRMRKLEEYKSAEIRRQEEIRQAVAFVRFSKTITYNNSDRSFYDVIAGKMEEANSSDSVSREGLENEDDVSKPVAANQCVQ